MRGLTLCQTGTRTEQIPLPASRLLWRLMIRVKDTRPQKELNGRERENNVKNAFQSPDNVVKYKRILIVDDIYTTGSTVEAVAERLKEAGAEQVYVLTACIGRGF